MEPFEVRVPFLLLLELFGLDAGTVSFLAESGQRRPGTGHAVPRGQTRPYVLAAGAVSPRFLVRRKMPNHV